MNKIQQLKEYIKKEIKLLFEAEEDDMPSPSRLMQSRHIVVTPQKNTTIKDIEDRINDISPERYKEYFKTIRSGSPELQNLLKLNFGSGPPSLKTKIMLDIKRGMYDKLLPIIQQYRGDKQELKDFKKNFKFELNTSETQNNFISKIKSSTFTPEILSYIVSGNSIKLRKTHSIDQLMNIINTVLDGLDYKIELIHDDELTENQEECNCGCDKCHEKTAMSLLQPDIPISIGLQYHLDNNLSLTENIYRPFSLFYFDLINEVRELYEKGLIKLCEDDQELVKLDVGKTILLENGKKIYLDVPVLVENEFLLEAEKKKKNPPLNKPKRGGAKKFYVYVRKPGGGIKKVSFGDTTGLSAKINNPTARRAFAKRHDCKNKKDKTKASYWSCRLPRYAKLLGLKSNFGGFW